jgi:Mg-chelatase subunit ChlD
MLCIDVSGSMAGAPLREAVRGARAFVAEAVEAHYEVGVVLWNWSVAAVSPPSPGSGPALEVLDRADAASGTDLLPALVECERILAGRRGDRVVAVFGDGDLGIRKKRVVAKVGELKADGVRFVTRGLGSQAAAQFALISSADDESPVEVRDVTELADGIGGMAKSLGSLGKRR